MQTQHTGIDKYRIANKSDIEAIVKLVNRAYRPASGASGWTHESGLVSGNRTNDSQITEIMSKPDSVILVGLSSSEIIACVHIEKMGKNSHLGMLAVSPALQGVGTGKQMLAHAEMYASVNFGSEKCVIVVVSSRTELISFYLRRNYQKTGVLKDYPLSAGVGTPKLANLKIEVLEKQFKIAAINAVTCAKTKYQRRMW
ncbi:MAG: GNAT family N-acetyltransferase [Methylococcaceae bacterium]|nr:GNAT family N-acetyltransferase [Methylococcaceae bacterium]